MVKIGYFLTCEDLTPHEIVTRARLAEEAGFDALWISDHYHPWNDAQGQSAFVWSAIGAISQVCRLPVTTAVTCPTMRIHPAVVAQAAATCAVLLEGRFVLGLGSGEALNEHILGDPWPATEIRLEMLEEAVAVIRTLWQGGMQSWDGDHYHVENARIYTLPDTPPPIYLSAFGPQAAELAGRVGDGFCCTKPDTDLIETFRESGGTGKPMQAGYKVCWDEDKDRAVKTAHRLWATSGLPGELAQVLPTPAHFEQGAQLVTEDMTRESTVCGTDPGEHVAEFAKYQQAGYDEIYISQIGPDGEGFFRFYRDAVLPRLRG